ncbi:putative pectinesterase 67 [Raphanus sativus]|nr:putative pectinesterase 67 [Raphanus sativus]
MHIPENKPFIFMRGNGKGKTVTESSQSSVDNVASATFKVEANHLLAFGISIRNDAPAEMAFTSDNQSVTAFVAADKVAIVRSLWYRTRDHRENAEENTGYVFIRGKVYGIDEVYLGRAKGPYSRVIFAKTYLSKTLVPNGWTSWSYDGSTKNLYHAE